jgi:hypothetical protein
MGKSAVFALIMAFALSTAQAGDGMARNGEGLALSYVGAFIATGAYASTGPGIGTTVSGSLAASATKNEIETRKQIAKMLINDVQEYYQSGSMTVNLQASVKGLRAQDSSLSDTEALDLLNSAALELLE